MPLPPLPLRQPRPHQSTISWPKLAGQLRMAWCQPQDSLSCSGEHCGHIHGACAETACCVQILKRINSEIERRRKAGEDLPPAPKTAIAGPEYFGLCQPDVCALPCLLVLLSAVAALFGQMTIPHAAFLGSVKPCLYAWLPLQGPNAQFAGPRPTAVLQLLGRRLTLGCLQFVEQLDMLDPDRECTAYWQGKAVRDQAIAGLPLAGPSSGPRPPRGSGPSRKKRTRCAGWCWLLCFASEYPWRLCAEGRGALCRACVAAVVVAPCECRGSLHLLASGGSSSGSRMVFWRAELPLSVRVLVGCGGCLPSG